MPKLLRGSAAIIIICVISAIILAAGAFFLLKKPSTQSQSNSIVRTQPTPRPTDETANWKTYTDALGAYKFLYPSAFDQVSVGVDKTDVFVITKHGAGKCTGEDNIDLFQVVKLNIFSLADYIAHLKEINPKVVTENITFSGEPAIESFFEGSEQSGGPGIAVGILHKNNVYEINNRYCLPPQSIKLKEKLPSQLPNILSTFKFTD